MHYASAVAAEVRAEIARQGKRNSDAAAVLGVHRVTASRILNGHRAMTVDEMQAVANWLRVPVTRFFAKVEA